MPKSLLDKHGQELLLILKDKMKKAVMDIKNDDSEELKTMQVCNNSCWVIGEIARVVPDKVKAHLQELNGSLAEILNSGIFELVKEKNEQMLEHFTKTISITLGRLGAIDP